MRTWNIPLPRVATTIFVAVALAATTGPIAMAQKHVTIKGGQIGGAFNRWTSAWSILLSKEIPGVKFSSESSTGSPENVRAVGSGSAGTGLVFASDLFNAYRGLDQYKKPQTQVGAVTYVFASVAHFIVPADSDFKTIQDIKGKRVSLGGPGSGSAVNLTLLLKQMGLWDGFKPVYLGRKSPEALRNGEIAAYNWHPGLGNAMIRNTATMMKVRFIDLDEPARKSGFYDKYPYFGKMTIPAGLYSGVNVATSTFGTGSILVAHKGLSADLVYQILKIIYSDKGREYMRGAVGKASVDRMTKESAFDFITVPLHPGAERFWKEQGVSIPAKLSSK
ncbi:MAG: TAXI family TRAP transporter solute-binding subunit [Betaproteobacteria bacterium]|nr:TAXI family TRAP transporter solute-binding subunit [Betaproteobacteria bacterium]MDH3436333.1 TAXI family TRAP transporter solute-binding subunit [Betaproteobacteria bacterium]